jgi:hypothetical protein
MLTNLRATTAAFAIALLTAGAIGAATPALARQNAQADVKTDQGSGKAAEKKICRSVEQIGSNSRERVCLTRSEWKRVDDYLRSN